MGTVYGPIWYVSLFLCVTFDSPLKRSSPSPILFRAACLSTATIYLCVGIKIWRERHVLRSFAKRGPEDSASSGESGGGITYTKGVYVATTSAQQHPMSQDVLSAEDVGGDHKAWANAPRTPASKGYGSNAGTGRTDAVALAYARFACLFFLSMICTWVRHALRSNIRPFPSSCPPFSLHLLRSQLTHLDYDPIVQAPEPEGRTLQLTSPP